LAARRLVLSQIPNPSLVKHLFDEIAPRYKDRPGGYTRIVKVENRVGDSAPMAFVELVGYEEEILKAIQERIEAKENLKQDEKKPKLVRGKVDKTALSNESAVEKGEKKRWPRGKWHPGSKKGSSKKAAGAAPSVEKKS
jgi:large subunit ribosomal protein L17